MNLNILVININVIVLFFYIKRRRLLNQIKIYIYRKIK